MDRQNFLLAMLSGPDLALLEPHLEAVELPVGLVLAEPATTISHAVFIDVGLCSVVSSLAEAGRIEVGLFGRDRRPA